MSKKNDGVENIKLAVQLLLGAAAVVGAIQTIASLGRDKLKEDETRQLLKDILTELRNG